MALDTSNSPTTDVKPVHPQVAAAAPGTDATHVQDATTKKADAPVGGGFIAATLADVRKIASVVEKSVSSDIHTLTFTPLATTDSANKSPAKPAENAAAKSATADKTSPAAEKAPGASATAEKVATTGPKTGSDTPAAAPENPAANAVKLVAQPGQPASTAAGADAAQTTPDPNANKSIYARVAETVAEGLGVPKVLVDAVEDVVGAAWNGVGNYATDLLSDNNLQKSMVTTSTDGQVQIDQQKAQQVIDMQAMKNVFQGDSGNQHIDQVNKMFTQASFHDPDSGKGAGDPSKETAEYKALDAQRTQAIAAGHKPGDSWSDKNGVYSIDKAGDLLEVTGSADKRDIKWIGQNGQSYEKDPSGNETWTKDGREIKQVGPGNFQFTDEHGNTTNIDGATGITVRRVAEGTITSYNQNRTAITREAAAQLNDGISTNPNAALYSHHDADGNQLVKDSLVHGETIFAKDGKNYRVHDGQVYLEDQYGQEQKLEQLPGFIKRLDNGNFQFDDITIDSKDVMTASDHNTKMADKVAVITAGPPATQLTVKAGNGDVTIAKKGQFTATAHTDAQTGATTEHQVSASGQNEFDYNTKTGTMAGDGITFTKNGTHIRNTNFAISSRGQIESASSWDAQNYASGINDASDAYISSHHNYNGSSSAGSYSDSSSGSGDGSTDGNGNGGNQDGSDEGSQPDDPNSYQEYDKEKDKEEKADEKKLSMWDALQSKFEAEAFKVAEDTGANKWRDDIKSGKLFDLPESWKVASIKDSVNVSGLQTSIGRADHGTVDTGDVSSIESVKAQLGSAASKFGFDADGYLAKLDGIEAKVEREVRVKDALLEVGADANPNHMWRVHQNGGTALAARELEERESA